VRGRLNQPCRAFLCVAHMEITMAIKTQAEIHSASKSPSTYESTDLFLSAFLKTKGLRLIEVRKHGDRATFVFNDRDDRKALTQDFFNCGSVRVSDFKNAIQDLKTLLFNV